MMPWRLVLKHMSKFAGATGSIPATSSERLDFGLGYLGNDNHSAGVHSLYGTKRKMEFRF